MRKNKALLKFLSNPVVIRRYYSPKIPRSIPVTASVTRALRYTEWGIVGIVSAVFVVLIIGSSLQVNQKIHVLSLQQAKKQSIENERAYWQKIVEEYPGYRDAYFKLAVLDYQLGDEADALAAVTTSLEIDPLFREGIAFKEKLLTEK